MKTYKPDSCVSIVIGNSCGIEPSMRVTKNRFVLTDEEKLEKMNISTIEKYLRKKKLNKLNIL